MTLFLLQAFDTQFGLDKHRANMHMSKEDREELEESSKSGQAKDSRSLKEIFEEKYGRLDKDEIPMAKEVPKEKFKREEPEEDEEEFLEVKEEVPSEDEMEEEEDGGQEEQSEAESDDDSNAFKEDNDSGDEDSSPFKRERQSSDDDSSLAKAAKFEIAPKEEPTSDTEETNNGPPFPCEIPTHQCSPTRSSPKCSSPTECSPTRS